MKIGNHLLREFRMQVTKKCLVVTTFFVLCFFLYNSNSSFPFNLWLYPSLRSMQILTNRAQWDPDLPNDPNQMCQIPQPDPWDKSILHFVSDHGPLHCRRLQPELTYIDKDSVLRINKSALEEAGYKPTSLKCKYQLLTRPLGKDDEIQYGQEEVLDFNGALIKSVDIVSVRCKNWIGWSVYANIHAHPRPVLKKWPKKLPTKTPLSVLLFGIDSMSRLNFMRQLPSTYKYLTKEMESIVLHGLTKVGDNTYPNIVAMLTGEMVNTGPWARPAKGVYFDTWPLIWKNYSQNGFLTLLAEDHPQFTVFNYLSSGFYHQPTDFYLRPFYVAMDEYSTYKLSSYLCFGASPKHLLHIRYVKDFLVNYHAKPYFAFSFLTEVSHNLLNQVSLADDDFENFLTSLHQGGYLDNTVLFFFGDHGHRFDSIRLTTIGRIEGSMPFCAIYLPPKIRDVHPELVGILKSNSRRLTSMYDFHSTLVDILQYNTLGTKLGSYQSDSSNWGLNLFREIPLNRTCKMAGVENQFCMCVQNEKVLTMDDHRLLVSAEAVVNFINDITDEYRQSCSLLNLDKIHNAVAIAQNDNFDNFDNSHLKGINIRVVLQVSPGQGIFEGLAEFRRDKVVVQGVNRINQYKGQDNCVSAKMMVKIDMRKYCYCR